MAGVSCLKTLLLWVRIISLSITQAPPAITQAHLSPQFTASSNTSLPPMNSSPPITTSNNITTTTEGWNFLLYSSITQSPPSPQCSYTVIPIKFGFRIDMINVTAGVYALNINEDGQPGTGNRSIVRFPNQSSSHEVKHLKPCTKYEHNVAFIDRTGKEIPCDHSGNVIMTIEMNQEDIKEVSCLSEYVCYRSDWDISFISLSTSNNISAEPCKGYKDTFCIKPGYDDICTDLTITFTSEECVNSSFNFTESITVDFLNKTEIDQIVPTKLPVKEKPKFPPNCMNLTVNYTCTESGKPDKPKQLSELEPFTNYNCTGHIKENNVIIKNTTVFPFRSYCDLKISNKVTSVTNTSIKLNWTTTPEKCEDVPFKPQNLSYDCSCDPHSKKQKTITVTSTSQGGTCHIDGLEPFTDYTCNVQPTYNGKAAGKPAGEVKQKTSVGRPGTITNLNEKFPEHNVISVTCDRIQNFNGPERKYIARLHYGSDIVKKLTENKCKFEFKDLSYSTTYELKVTAFNGYLEGNPKTKTVHTLYNEKAVIGFLVSIICVVVVVAVAVYILKCRKSRDAVNEDMMLESEAIYVNVRPK